MKRCFKCLRDLPITEFYRHRMMADGHLSKCKDCARADMKQHRLDHPERVRETDQLKYRRRREAHQKLAHERAKRKGWVSDARTAWKAKNAAKLKANQMVSNAIRDRRLRRPSTCDFCHKACRVEAHHWDYGKPFTVTWVCRRCHRIADHARREAEQRLKRKANTQC